MILPNFTGKLADGFQLLGVIEELLVVAPRALGSVVLSGYLLADLSVAAKSGAIVAGKKGPVVRLRHG